MLTQAIKRHVRHIESLTKDFINKEELHEHRHTIYEVSQIMVAELFTIEEVNDKIIYKLYRAVFKFSVFHLL